MEISKISQIGVPVQDINRATLFYKKTLGLTHLFSSGNMAFFDCDGVRILLSAPENEEFADASSSVIYFQVEDIQSSYQELVDKEVLMIDEPHLVAKVGITETWMTFFKNSEGNTHALLSEVSSVV
ncbi:glyoxalase [Bacillus sp. LL01]|uniref:VOC family protein n=1 Tax=Bacillus sp. LL01 TaxID=1665556 RepID=UPI00064D2275|nr:VOC family protein [Bacillus sp. LL01]KMJ60346.1 glyoxalase [Bacillus sp. LL01]